MIELLWLLLPVAAASGWLVGRRRGGEREPPVERALSADYFRGLNHLLNEQPDKAIEVFIRMLEAEGETAEIHLALGSLFRRRGEVDRAIRIHQNLIARPTLTTDQRGQALLELGFDYLRAGLYDRAEAIFLDLVEMHAHGERALRELIEIYQQEKEWQKAIDASRRLAALTGTERKREIAHYHCEMAEEHRVAGDPERATGEAGKALSVDEGCVRASLLIGEIETERGNPKAALRAFRRVPEQDPDYLPVALDGLQGSYAALDRLDDYQAFLREQAAETRTISPVLALAELIEARDGPIAAGEFIVGQLDDTPSIRGLERVIALSLEVVEGQPRDILAVLHRMVAELIDSKPLYRCGHCGFEGRSLHWHCPSCRQWSSVKPIIGIEGV